MVEKKDKRYLTVYDRQGIKKTSKQLTKPNFKERINMYTRKMYMNKECTYEQYYGQFVTHAVLELVSRKIGHIGDNSEVPLTKWDSLYHEINWLVSTKYYRINLEGLTLATSVCIAKEAARQLRIKGGLLELPYM